MIVSLFVLVKKLKMPLMWPPRGGQIGANGDEQGGVEEGGGAGGASEGRAVAVGGPQRSVQNRPYGMARDVVLINPVFS